MRDAPHPGDGPATGARVRLVPVGAANRGAVAALTVAPEQSVGHRRGGCELLARRHHHRRLAPGRGLGRSAVTAALDLLADRATGRGFALSDGPDNHRAAALYRGLGFVETGEQVDGELVARLCR